jgi:uncharacterized membrane protein YhaH (DUF805 family)
MGFGQAIATGFRKYVVITGYASRAEYWWWQLFVLLSSIGTTVLDIWLIDPSMDASPLNTLWSLAVLLPTLTIGVRRLRDAGYAWGWMFVPIVSIVLLCQPTKPRYVPMQLSHASAQ